MTAGLIGWAAAAAALVALGVQLRQRRRLAARLERSARASHELRGALGAIGLALARLDRATADSGTWREGVEALRSQHERARLAVDELDTARAGSAPRSEPSAPVDLEPLVRRAVRSWAAVHGRWRVVLDWRAGRPVVKGHAARLAQALDNLIANGLEHGSGPVTIVGRLAGGSVTVAVLDRGRGVQRPSKHIRPGSWRSPRGHGLVIARRAVEQHGGRMRLVREGRGAGIEIRLPLSSGPSAPAHTGTPATGPDLPSRVARSG